MTLLTRPLVVKKIKSMGTYNGCLTFSSSSSNLARPLDDSLNGSNPRSSSEVNPPRPEFEVDKQKRTTYYYAKKPPTHPAVALRRAPSAEWPVDVTSKKRTTTWSWSRYCHLTPVVTSPTVSANLQEAPAPRSQVQVPGSFRTRCLRYRIIT